MASDLSSQPVPRNRRVFVIIQRTRCKRNRPIGPTNFPIPENGHECEVTILLDSVSRKEIDKDRSPFYQQHATMILASPLFADSQAPIGCAIIDKRIGARFDARCRIGRQRIHQPNIYGSNTWHPWLDPAPQPPLDRWPAVPSLY